MAYYKLTKDGEMVEVLKNPTYVRYAEKSGQILISPRAKAFGILSPKFGPVHILGFKKPSQIEYETMELALISEEEYKKIKIFNGKTPEEIIDEYTLSLIEGGLL